ncbi:hypothetical protein ACNKHU_17710 [Shigella flexneri]
MKVFALPDGDVAASVLTCWQDNPCGDVHHRRCAEGVISACAVKHWRDMQAELIDFPGLGITRKIGRLQSRSASVARQWALTLTVCTSSMNW